MLVGGRCRAMVLSVGAQAAVKDGTFEGTGAGRGGPVTVAVTFEKGRIADVKVVKQTETVGVSDRRLSAFPPPLLRPTASTLMR